MRKSFAFFGVCVTLALVLVHTANASTGAQFYIGSKADIDAIRAMVRHSPGEDISAAHITGDYALVQWNSQHAGEPQIYKRVAGEKWKMIMTGSGGPMFLKDMLHGGIPEATARQLCSNWPKGYGECVNESNGKLVPWP